MKKKNNLHCIVYRLRKAGVKIDMRERTVYYEYQNATDAATMERKAVERLCKEFGFARQAQIN